MDWAGLAAITLPLWLAALLVGGAILGSVLSATTRRKAERFVLLPATFAVCFTLLVISIPAQDWRGAGVAIGAGLVCALAWRRRARKAGTPDG